MWRRPVAHGALRGRTLPAYPEQEMVVAEGMGPAGGAAARDTSSHRRGRQAPGGGSAPDVGRWQRVLLEQGQRRGSCGCVNPPNAGKQLTRSATAEKCPHGDDGWGEFARSVDPAAEQRQGRP